MADYAPNFTCRYKVKYSSWSRQHTMQFRVARGVTDPTGIATKVTSFLNTLTAKRFTDWTVLGASFAVEDSDIFLPAVAPTPAAGTVSLSGHTTAFGVSQIGFVGRSSGGQRAALFMYGTLYTPDPDVVIRTDFRITAAEDAAVSDAVAALDELSPALVGSDNNPVNWYGYINLKDNDYWLGKARRG